MAGAILFLVAVSATGYFISDRRGGVSQRVRPNPIGLAREQHFDHQDEQFATVLSDRLTE